MPPIVASAEIERPAAEVFAYATDPAREPLTGSRNEMPANVAALRQQTEAG